VELSIRTCHGLRIQVRVCLPIVFGELVVIVPDGSSIDRSIGIISSTEMECCCISRWYCDLFSTFVIHIKIDSQALRRSVQDTQ